jgi:hypothetical protein
MTYICIVQYINFVSLDVSVIFFFMYLDLDCRLIDYLGFYVPFKNFSLMWRRHHYRWRAAKFRPMPGAQGLWAGRDLYRATPAVKRCLGIGHQKSDVQHLRFQCWCTRRVFRQCFSSVILRPKCFFFFL